MTQERIIAADRIGFTGERRKNLSIKLSYSGA